MTKVNPKNGTFFFHATYSNMTSVFIGHKILKYLNDFKICIFQFHCKSELKQVK